MEFPKIEGLNSEELSKLESALQSKEFSDSLSAQTSVEGVQAAMATRNIHFTVEEISKIRDALNAMYTKRNQDQELSEDALEDVAGGLFDGWKINFFW